jgi:iron complex outermembrane receptor protein
MLSGDYTHEEHGGSAEVLLYANNANPNVATANGVPLDSRFICGRHCNYDTYTADALSNFNGYFYTDPVAGPTLVPWDVYNPLSQIPGNPLGTFTVPFGPLSGVTGSPHTLYDGWGVSGNIKINLSDNVSLTSITGYRQWSSSFTADQDLSPANTGLGLNELHDKFFSQELRLNAKFGDVVQGTLGGYYSDEKSRYWTLQDIRYAPIPLQFIGNDPINTSSKAVFGTLIIKPVKGFTLTAGVRYTKEHKDYTFQRYMLDGVTPNPFLGSINGQKAIYNGQRTDYRVSLDYRFSPSVMAYATVSTGFKGGGVSPRPFNPVQVVSFNPETVTTYEVGVKTDFFDRRLRINVAAFYYD